MLEDPTNKIHNVTMDMREAGASILSDPDNSYSYEEMAEAVYIAMATRFRAGIVRSQKLSTVDKLETLSNEIKELCEKLNSRPFIYPQTPD